MSTSAGWDGVLDGIINEEDCLPPNNEMGYPGNCGSSTIGIAFLLAYLVISFLIVINMYIAVILENYSQVSICLNHSLVLTSKHIIVFFCFLFDLRKYPAERFHLLI